jgi:hypothetical protein
MIQIEEGSTELTWRNPEYRDCRDKNGNEFTCRLKKTQTNMSPKVKIRKANNSMGKNTLKDASLKRMER